MADTVKIFSPPGAFTPTGTWSLGARAGDFVFVAGMRGIDPATNKMVEGEEARIRQAFEHGADRRSEGAKLKDCVRLTVFVTDMAPHRRSPTRCRRNCGLAGPIRRARSSSSRRSPRAIFSRWKAHFTRPLSDRCKFNGRYAPPLLG